MRRTLLLIIFFSLSVILAGGCTTATTKYPYQGLNYEKDVKYPALKALSLTPDIEKKILALDPEHITEKEIKEVLSHAPAPRIIKIHGGVYPVLLMTSLMKSFSEFLISMGYPDMSIRNPADGKYSYSCYFGSEKLAGLIAWYYEREGMRPMIVGHSQGGIQAVKILHELAGSFNSEVSVWNPITEEKEERTAIIDPLTGIVQPVVGMKLPYVTAVGAGGLTRLIINQWSMAGKLRIIPDSVEEFTGFYKGMDVLGGDYLGFGPMNKFAANGKARVRNVQLPILYSHVTVPETRHLAESQEIRDWINSYTPTEEPELTVKFESPSQNILWAADVWHSIKKHWVLELQRLIRAKQKLENGN
jgi:hypothetical protein